MKKHIKTLSTLFFVLVLISCGGSDDGSSNVAPNAVTQVVFPTSDLLCVDNTINFQWNAATDADGDPITYRVQIATDRDLVNIVEDRTTTTNSITLTLQQGVAYYWHVTAVDNSGEASEPSPTLAFYTSGPGITNYAPFTAALNSPTNDSDVPSGSVNLDWTGADTDTDDILTYDLFFGENSEPPLLQSGLNVENFNVSTSAGTTYFWRIDTIDNSNIKTIGQVWTFTAN